MFSLPKQLIKPYHKTTSNKQSILNQTQIRKRTNINYIKQQIQYILNRNNSPLSLHVQKQIQKSQKHLHSHLLQRKRSKILQRTNQQNIQKAKNNRKLYQDYLLGGNDLVPKSYTHNTNNNNSNNNTNNKSIQMRKAKQSFHTLTLKQTSYGKQMISKQFSTSKANFNNSHRSISLNNNKKQQQSNIFIQKDIYSIGLGKLFFYKDSNLKLKRSNLLNSGQTMTQRKNLFKQTAMQSFYPQSNIDINKYLKPQNNSINKNINQQEQSKPKYLQTIPLPRQRSLQIFKKQIIPKQSTNIQQLLPSSNPQELKINGTPKQYDYYHQKQTRRQNYDYDHHYSSHNHKQTDQMNQTLNVMDQQLLVYYGKLKNRKMSNHYISQNHHKSILNRSHSKNSSNQTNNIAKLLDIGLKTSIQIKKTQIKRQNSWKIHNLDPWQKLKFDQQTQHQHTFGSLQQQNHSIKYQESNKIKHQQN